MTGSATPFDRTTDSAREWGYSEAVVLMVAYSTLALSCLVAAVLLVRKRMGWQDSPETLTLPNRLLWFGFPLLIAGLIIGARWAKGTWDPKETWSFLTWAFYLIPLHQRVQTGEIRSLWLPLLGFPIVLVCWFGVNYLPTATQSIHAYTN